MKGIEWNRILLSALLIFCVSNLLIAQVPNPEENTAEESDTLRFPIGDREGGVYLDNPWEYKVEYDPITDMYKLTPSVGELNVGAPIYLTAEQYIEMIVEDSTAEHFKQKSRLLDQAERARRNGEDTDDLLGSIIPSFEIKSPLFEAIFGGSKIELIPQGSASFDLGVFLQNIENPQILPQNRQTFTFDIQQRIQMSILGKVGENLSLQANYDTQAGFAFENRLNLAWKPTAEGGEDNILQNIEVGNINMPLNTSLIQGAQSLFGVKTELKFGNTYLTTVFSQQQSETRNITVQGDGVLTNFDIFAEDYNYNQHFFLGQFFKEEYDSAFTNYPLLQSTITITRLEVYKIDRGNANQQERRSVLAIRDLGDQSVPMHTNDGAANTTTDAELYYNAIADEITVGQQRDVSEARQAMNNFVDTTGVPFREGTNFVINENARKLNPSEYYFNPQLGTITLNQPLTDGEDMLAVSFQYTDTSRVSGNSPQVFQVGDMSNEEDELLVLKLLKSNTDITDETLFDLMMKNVYSLDAFGVSQEDFLLNLLFLDLSDTGSGKINYIPEEGIDQRTLLQVLNMDRLNLNGDVQAQGDGLFDFVPNLTIFPQNGFIHFTSVEPFGDYLREQLNRAGITDAQVQDQYVFDAMYTNLQGSVEQEPLAKRYSLSGRFKGETSGGIPLGAFNVPQGSVRVTANGQELLEGVDYTVDYQLGRVNIINTQIKNSGVPINVSLENQSTFNLQQKRFMGLHAQHVFSDKLQAGVTMLNYQERPLTQKANFGVEPVNNTMFGANVNYQDELDILTRFTNKIPGVKTDAPSNVSFAAEGAYLLPGLNNAVNDQSIIDDFEDSQANISLLDFNQWFLGSTPGSVAGTDVPNSLFPNGTNTDDLSYGNGRRLLSWYRIDPRFYGLGGTAPLDDQDLSNHRSRRVQIQEIFNQVDLQAATNNFLPTFDITFYPQFRGPYNVNPTDTDTENWGALTRALTTSNFIDANVEYIEFWLMDPYADNTGGEGQLLIHLGNVSEDVLRDGQQQFENGLPADGDVTTPTLETSNWGVQPDNFPVLYAFDTEGAERVAQDVGYDGLGNTNEGQFFGAITDINPVTGNNDIAGDDYVFFLDDRWDSVPDGNSVLSRYRYFQGTEGNSPTNSLDASRATPDAEDVNLDYNLDQTERYNEYAIPITRDSLRSESNQYIVARKTVTTTFENGQTGENNWYQFRIPVDEFTRGEQNVLSSVRFVRLVMQGFEQETTLRFATLDLVRSEWRRFRNNLAPDLVDNEGQSPVDISDFSIGEVDIEQNATNQPPYVLPPGVVREQLQGTTGFAAQNESSLVLQGKFEKETRAYGIFKNVNLDLRRYKRLQMFVHAQNITNQATRLSNELDEDAKLFLRLGSDYINNYYEFELPLKYTSMNATSPMEIWPDENYIDLVTDLFVDAKKQRDVDLGDGIPGVSSANRYEFIFDEESLSRIFVKGRPSLGNVSSLMIGIRDSSGVDKELVVWVNELRLSEIENNGGYAANANLQFNLGDFANVQATGSHSSVGFGAIDQGPSQRQQESVTDYAVSAQINVDKFFPEKWGLQVPVNVSIAEQFIDPEFNPLDTDVKFDEAPNRSELKKVVRTYTKRRSIGVSNLRKVKTAGGNQKKHFWDVENFAFNFLFADEYYRDIYTAYNIRQNLRASANYNYSFKKLEYKPFKDWRAVQDSAKSSRYLQWVKEFNVNPLPTRFSFRTDVVRTYNEQQFRDLSVFLTGSDNAVGVNFSPIFASNFLFGWQYNLGFDLTRSFRIDYTSSTQTLNDGSTFQVPDQSLIWKNLVSVGRPILYDHQIQLNYKLPTEQLPFLEWSQVELGYTAAYNWQATSTALRFTDDTTESLGNLAQNSNAINIIASADFNSIYRNMESVKRLDSIKLGRRRELDSLTKAYEQIASFRSKRRRKAARRKKFKFKNKYKLSDYLTSVYTSVKNVQLTWNQNNGSILPGVLYEPNFFGFASDGNGPGTGYLFGSQFDIRRRAVTENWISSSEFLQNPYQRTRNLTFQGSALIQPFDDLRIDLRANRSSVSSQNVSGFNLTDENGVPIDAFVNELSNFNTSTYSLGTAFSDPDQVYDQFLQNAQVLSQRLGSADAQSNPDANNPGFFEGYSLTNADVLVPAFVSAYQGRDANNVSLDYKTSIPLPNWNIAYNGLTKIPWVNKRFTTFEVSHGYSSVYAVTGVQSNINHFSTLGNAAADRQDLNGNFFTSNIYGGISLAESFAPLIGVNMQLRNNLQIRMQYNRDRIVNLSIANFTLSENYGSEFIFGLGYVFKDLKIKMRYRGKRKTITGDFNLRADVSLRNDESRLRNLLENSSQIIGGQRLLSIRVSADYDLSQNFNLRFFYDHNATSYLISTAFPLTTIRTGLQATFTFGN